MPGKPSRQKKKKMMKMKMNHDLPQQPCLPTDSLQNVTSSFCASAVVHSGGAEYLGG